MKVNVRIIGVSGGSGSGKSTVVKRLKEKFDEAVVIEMDNYYKSASFVSNDNITAYNFDHPDAFDMNLLLSNIMDLRNGRSCRIPQYDFVHHRRKDETLLLEPRPVIIIDGLMVFYDERIREMLDLKIYIDTPPDIRFIRRLRRDVEERGRTVSSVIEQYLNVVRPGHYNFIEPGKAMADLIIPEGGYNDRAMEVLYSFISAMNDEMKK